jgi:vancomycin resistance protein YoaR
VQPLPEDESPPAELRRRHGRPLPRRRAGRALGRLLLAVLLGVGFFAALPFLLGLWAGDRVAEGVSLQGQPVAGLGRAELIAQIDARYAAFGRAPLTLIFEGRSWRPALADLGARLDSAALADELLAAGQRGGPIARLSQRWQIWRGGLDLAPRLSVDGRALQRYLLALGVEIELAPRDAALSIAEGRVLPTPAQIGRQVLADETASEVLRALATLGPQTVVLRTRTLEPRLTDAAVAPAAAAARTLLSKPLVLTRGDERWTWEPTKIAELLAVESDRGSMRVQIDPERLNRAVAKLAQLADSGSSEPRLAFRAGKLAITQPGQTGWRIQQEQAAEAISQTLRLSQGELALPVEQLTPQVTEKTLASLGIGELVGEGKSSFAGSAPYRITNIKAGVEKLDGVLIPPGGEFSFNTQIGEIDESNGFVQGYAVIGNRTQLEWGGGICQDSTTVFRAAFWAGLPITERHAHPFYISWYDDFSYGASGGPGDGGACRRAGPGADGAAVWHQARPHGARERPRDHARGGCAQPAGVY